MLLGINFLLVLKYIIAIAIVVIVICAPAYLARQNKKSAYDMVLIRIASWLFSWTGIGWLWALYWAIKK